MYKILLLTYKCIHGLAPIYLQELVKERKPIRNLRSSSQSLLTCPTSQTKSYGDRTFSRASSELWNNLPLFVKDCETVEAFKTCLKTYLFSIAF